MTRSITVLDGGVGHELGTRGHRSAELWSTLALLDAPEAVRQLHDDYVAAGAEIITTNTYATVPLYLEREPELLSRADELIDLAVDLAAEAARAARHRVRIAASIGPLDESYRPDLVRSDAEMAEWYGRMAKRFAGRVDLVLCETMSSIRETVAAVRATSDVAPVWIGWTLGDDEPAHLKSGEPVRDAVAALDGEAAALLLNCSTLDAIDQAIPVLADSTALPIGAYGNGFPPVPKDFDLASSAPAPPVRVEVDTYLEHARRWVDSGASIIGGCCDIGPDHIAAISDHFGRPL